MRIGSNEIDVELPRALVGGLKQGPTEELLQRVALECAHLSDENTKLEAVVERLEHELARVALAAAQRSAHEMRESARRECELMLKKASSRTRKLERDLRHARVATDAELRELESLRREVCEQMRSALQTILMTPV